MYLPVDWDSSLADLASWEFRLVSYKLFDLPLGKSYKSVGLPYIGYVMTCNWICLNRPSLICSFLSLSLSLSISLMANLETFLSLLNYNLIIFLKRDYDLSQYVFLFIINIDTNFNPTFFEFYTISVLWFQDTDIFYNISKYDRNKHNSFI